GFDGDYSIFSAGLGLGASYKFPKNPEYPIEIGAYLVPQVSGTDDKTTATFSTILHSTLFHSFGIGLGYRFWEKGIGFVKMNHSRLFVTFGYGLTNKKD
ncbi:MAG TPA: hypothetical protein VHO70_02535, partial [Chitinispirillaceae bacterium]|nr:hypothetical protein [Chitinispirillaceae bacterium]